MTEREFCYWLQGLFEVGKPEALNAEQTEMIRKHLALVFTNVTAKPSLAPNLYATPDHLGRIDKGAQCGLGIVKDQNGNIIARC